LLINDGVPLAEMKIDFHKDEDIEIESLSVSHLTQILEYGNRLIEIQLHAPFLEIKTKIGN
jgi:hypothetical protein